MKITNRIPFTLEEYQGGKYKVVTRVGKRAKIVCTDMKSLYNKPIIAIISESNEEELYYSFSPNGSQYNSDNISDYDLFLEEVIFEDGDIVTNEKDIAIYKEIDKCYCGISEQGCLAIDAFFYYEVITRLATEAEKQRLFDALKKNGKQWNNEKKCIEDIKEECELKPFDRVLVRDYDGEEWGINLFSHYASFNSYRFICSGNEGFNQCISFDGNEELLGTTNKPKI